MKKLLAILLTLCLLLGMVTGCSTEDEKKPVSSADQTAQNDEAQEPSDEVDEPEDTSTEGTPTENTPAEDTPVDDGTDGEDNDSYTEDDDEEVQLSPAEEALELLLAGEDDKFNERTIANEGNLARLADVMRRSQKGERVTILTYGNGCNSGNDSEDQIDLRYTQNIKFWWEENIGPCTMIEDGIDNLTSIVACQRVAGDVLRDEPDLVILDFSVQDGINSQAKSNSLGYDNLIRRILQSESKPAVMALLMTGAEQTSFSMNPNNAAKFATAGAEHKKVALYYNLPILDFETVFWQTAVELVKVTTFTEIPLLNWNVVGTNNVSLNEAGHTLLSGMFIHYFEKIFNKLSTIKDKESYPTVGFFENDKYMNYDFISVADICYGEAEGYAFDLSVSDMSRYGYTLRNVAAAKSPSIRTYRHYISPDGVTNKEDEVNPHYLSLTMPTVKKDTAIMFCTTGNVSTKYLSGINSEVNAFGPISVVCYNEKGNDFSTTRVVPGTYNDTISYGKAFGVTLPAGTTKVVFKIYTSGGTIDINGISVANK